MIKGIAETLQKVGKYDKPILVMNNISKEALLAEILAARAIGGGTHCSNCGHCKATL